MKTLQTMVLRVQKEMHEGMKAAGSLLLEKW
jgi:hypothetical protein